MVLITISDSIKEEIARRVVEIASAGYVEEYQGSWYVVDGERVMHRDANAPWNPWYDEATVIHVNDLVCIYGGAEAERASFENGYDGADDFDVTVEFALNYVPDNYDAADYAARSQE